MNPNAIYARLKELAPAVSFEAEVSRDEYPYGWDGDGPSPAEEGYVESNVDVTAKAIHQGNLFSGEANMGGHWVKPGEHDPDFGGYLPQMLQEAADELAQQLPGEHPVRQQLCDVHAFLKAELQARYAEQMTPK